MVAQRPMGIQKRQNRLVACMLQSGPKDGVSVDIGEASGRHTMSALDRICMAWSSDVVIWGRKPLANSKEDSAD
jgi:hypothetical protein